MFNITNVFTSVYWKYFWKLTLNLTVCFYSVIRKILPWIQGGTGQKGSVIVKPNERAAAVRRAAKSSCSYVSQLHTVMSVDHALVRFYVFFLSPELKILYTSQGF